MNSKSDINVTPLVDVMLVLLVIFMVVTPLLKQQLPVELPLAAHSHEAQETSQVTLVAAADGTLFLNEQPIAAEALDDALHDLYAERVRTRLSSSKPIAACRTAALSI